MSKGWTKAKTWWEVAPSTRNFLIGMATLCICDIRDVVLVCGECGYKRKYNVDYHCDEVRCKACRTINKL